MAAPLWTARCGVVSRQHYSKIFAIASRSHCVSWRSDWLSCFSLNVGGETRGTIWANACSMANSAALDAIACSSARVSVIYSCWFFIRLKETADVQSPLVVKHKQSTLVPPFSICKSTTFFIIFNHYLVGILSMWPFFFL